MVVEVSSVKPFVLDFSSAGTLADQLADNIRRAIAAGTFRCGDKLPGLRRMAQLCGTSLAVPRAAIRKLAASGEVKGRPGSGCIVLAHNSKVWRGRILNVVVGSCASYSRDTFFQELSKILARACYHADFVMVPKQSRGDRGYDFSELKRSLKQDCSLVVAMACDAAIPRFLKASGLPHVLIASNIFSRQRGCVGLAAAFFTTALEDFAEHCSEAGIRRVLQVDFPGCTVDAAPALSRVGVRAERLTITPEFSPSRLESFRQCAYAAVARRLADRRSRRPDLVFFADDFLAAGGILAMSDAGLRAPRDVKLVTFANRGLTPAYSAQLTRVEWDPAANAAKFARKIIAFLSGEAPIGVIPFTAKYIRGDTF